MQTCRVCRGKLERSATTVTRTVNGLSVQVTGVPVDRCVDCGEEWFCARDLKQVERLIAKRGQSQTLAFATADDGWNQKVLREAPWLQPGNLDRPITYSDLLEAVEKVRH